MKSPDAGWQEWICHRGKVAQPVRVDILVSKLEVASDNGKVLQKELRMCAKNWISSDERSFLFEY